MKLLWDTHTFLWFISGSPSLSVSARNFIEAPSAENFLSIASIWEMAIKHSTGKLSFSYPFDSFIEQQIALNGLEILPINLKHLSLVATLPFHHKDPFDRLLIAQAITEKIDIISIDSALDSYSVTRLW